MTHAIALPVSLAPTQKRQAIKPNSLMAPAAMTHAKAPITTAIHPTNSHAAPFNKVINIPVHSITGGIHSATEQIPNYGFPGSWGVSDGCSRTCQYQYHPPQKSPTQKVTEKIIKIQGVNSTPTQRKKKNPAVKASFRGESMYTVIGVQGGQVA